MSRFACIAAGTLALALAPAAAAAADVSASKLKACSGSDAEALKLRVTNISCRAAQSKVVQGRHKQGRGCEQPGTGKTCHTKVAGFACTHRESKNPDGVGVLVKVKCTKKTRKHGKQTVHWQYFFAG